MTTKVKAPDEDNWSKLVHLVQYLRGTSKCSLTLIGNRSGILKSWVDAFFAVHPNMWGYSGGGLSFGRVFPIVGSTKQKINTKSSAETEIVGVDYFCQPSDGPDISLRHTVTMSGIIAYTGTTRVVLFWRRMGRPWSAKEQSTLPFSFSLSPIGLITVKYHWFGIPRRYV